MADNATASPHPTRSVLEGVVWAACHALPAMTAAVVAAMPCPAGRCRGRRGCRGPSPFNGEEVRDSRGLKECSLPTRW
jgi:hypothetical protein